MKHYIAPKGTLLHEIQTQVKTQPSGQKDIFKAQKEAVVKTKTTYTKPGAIQKLEEEKTQTTKELASLEKQKTEIIPTQQYYTDPSRSRWMSGSLVVSRVIDPAIAEREKHIASITSTQREWKDLPSGTVFKRTHSGWTAEQKPPDPLRVGKKMVATKQAFEKIEEKQPTMTGISLGYSIFAGVGSHFASTASPSVKYIPWTGPRLLGTPFSVVSPQIAGESSRKLSTVHFPTVLDVAFEPIGFAPKGSTEIVGEMGAGFWAGGLAYEAAVGYGISKGVKITSGFLKPYTSKLTSKISSKLFPSRQFALKGKMVAPYHLAEKPQMRGTISLFAQRFGERTGLAKVFKVSRSAVYKRHWIGLPKVTESGKTIMGTKSVWVHAGGPSYRSLLKETVKTGGAIGYDPLSRQLTVVGTRYSYKPFGIFKKYRVSKEVVSSRYGYVDRVTQQFRKTGDIWKLGGEIVIPDEYGPSTWKLGGQAGGTITRTPTPGFIDYGKPVTLKGVGSGAMPRTTMTRGEQSLLQFIEATGPPYEPVSGLMPSTMIKEFPKVVFISRPSVLGRLPVGGVSGIIGGVGGILFTGVKPRYDVKPKFETRYDYTPRFKTIVGVKGMVGGRGMQVVSPVSDVASVTGLDVVPSKKTGFDTRQAFMQKTSLVSPVPVLKSISVGEPKVTGRFPFLFPKSGVYGRGRGGYPGGGLGLGYKIRVFKPSPLKLPDLFKGKV